MKKGKILVLSNTFAKTQQACELLEVGGYQVMLIPELADNEKPAWINSAIKNVSAVIVGHDRLDKALIETAQMLKVIAKQGVGLDNIDTKIANERGISIVTAAKGNSDSVADLTILLMLAVSRLLIPANTMVKNGGWSRVIGHEISHKNLGIIGFGEIGQRVAFRARGFSMSISYFDIVEQPDAEQLLCANKFELPDLLSWADYISIHLPLNKYTAKIINKDRLALMKPTAYLINTSRGGVLDETALLEFLVENKLAGAGLDVFENEPPSNLSLAMLPNVVATPHMAAYTYEAIDRVSMQVAHAVLETLSHKI